MSKPNPKTDLQGLLGTASRAKEIERSNLDTKTPQHKSSETLVSQDTNTLLGDQERRINVALRESVHRPLRIHSVKSGRQLRDVVEEAVTRYLREIGET